MRRYWCLAMFGLIVFFVFLFYKTVGGSDGGDYLVHTAVFGDFLFTMPLARLLQVRFSHFNFFVEHPLFAGYGLSYHFGFYVFVALLNMLLGNIVYALNIASIVGLFFFIYASYKLVGYLFPNSRVKYWAGFSLLINPALVIVPFVQLANKVGVSNIFMYIKDNFYIVGQFFQFFPYRDTDLIAVFWNINTYLNQRHIIVGLGLLFYVLALFYEFIEKPTFKKGIILGVLVFLLSFVHRAFYLVFIGVLGLVYLYRLYKQDLFKNSLYIMLGILTLAGFVLNVLIMPPLSHVVFEFKPLLYHPGLNLVSFYMLQLGLLIPLGVYGVVRAYQESKKDLVHWLVLITIISVFVVANFVRFAPDVWVAHKFINLIIIVLSWYVMYLLEYSIKYKKRFLGIVVLLFFANSIFNLMLDVPVYFSNTYMSFNSNLAKETRLFVEGNTRYNARFLNLTYDVLPVTLAGRPVYFGWDYYAWSMGYPTQKRRNKLIEAIDQLPLTNKLCDIMQQDNLDYLFLKNGTDLFVDKVVNSDLVLKNQDTRFINSGYIILSFKDLCR